MKRKLVFATNNPHKLEEITEIIGKDSIELYSLKDLNCDTDIPETADTLEGNALLKAQYICNTYHIDCFSDDTGLEVESLGNRPGVHSARYAGEEKSSQANITKLLHELEGKSNRKAQFRTVIALIINGEEKLFEGIVKGEIIRERRGENGFGYDPVFIPEGYNRTFAELGNEIKNKISHRAKAIRQLCEYLKSI